MKYVLSALLVMGLISFGPSAVSTAHADCGHRIIC
jgi:hypothetical protein